jgi:hypothetical protein
VVRSVTLSVKSKGFVEAAAPARRITSAHPFPGDFAFRDAGSDCGCGAAISYAIFLVAALGFLVGATSSPNWGLMVRARNLVNQLPGRCIFQPRRFGRGDGVNLMADGLKRVLQALPVAER